MNIQRLSLFPAETNRVKSRNQYVSQSIQPKYKFLQADTFTFTGNSYQKDAREFLNNLYNSDGKKKFDNETIDKIVDTVTPKNAPYLEDITNLIKNRNSGKDADYHEADAIKELMNYLNKDETDINEFEEKFSNFRNLKRIVDCFGFKKSALSEYFDKIPAKGVVDILESDVLLGEPKHNLRSLVDAYNVVVDYFRHCVKKSGMSEEEYINKKGISGILKPFSSILIAGMVFDDRVCKELIYNRGKYLESVYIPRFKMLNGDDLEFLRKVQTSGITEKENKSGNLATYGISLNDTINTMNLLASNREIINAGYEGINFNDYITPVNINNPDGNFKINFHNIKIDLMDKVLRRIGIDSDVVDKYIQNYKKAYSENPVLARCRKDFWDINYVHLINSPEGQRHHMDYIDYRIKNNVPHITLPMIIKAATNGNFEKMLYEEGPIAKINALNREEFTRNGINYDKWLHPTIKPISQEFICRDGRKVKTFTVKNWDRCPQESIFDGNYTTCCTGIDKDQGESFLHFMTNTASTTLEVRTEKNKVIAMSRILMVKIDGELSMVIENIEMNNKMVKHYLYNDETKYKLREMIFDYARQFAKEINNTNKEIPVYFSGKYYKIADIQKGLQRPMRYDDTEPIGIFPNCFYFNAHGSVYDYRVTHDEGLDMYLSNVTKKSEPEFSPEMDADSDSNYNYSDTANYRG